MTSERQAGTAQDARAAVLDCVLSHLSCGEPFPSVRSIQRETGIPSLATVSKYVHRLAGEGCFALPEARYAAPEAAPQILCVRRKRLRLPGAGEVVVPLAICRDAAGTLDVRVLGPMAGKETA